MPPSDTPLTRDRILEAATDVVRRHGPEKATVTDVARALGVSHAAVYRHFPSKAALRSDVVAHWIERLMPGLRAVVADKRLAPDKKLRRFFDDLIAGKRKRAADDPELSAAFRVLVVDAKAVTVAHVDELAGLLAAIVTEGVAAGAFTSKNPRATGRALLWTTLRFHHPFHSGEWSDPALSKAFEEVWDLLLTGLRAK